MLQGSQTNWKYILIVVILAVIVGGILNWQWLMVKQETKIPELKAPEKVTKIDINKYLHEDAILRGVEMPSQVGYKAISLEEAIQFAIRYLENKGVKEIKICETKWIAAPLGGFLIDGFGDFIIEEKEYSTFRIGIKDGSEGNTGEVFVFIARGEDEKGNIIWYPEPGPDFHPAEGEVFPEELMVYEFLVDRERFESLSDRFIREEAKDETAKCSPIDFVGYELVKNYKFDVDLNNDGEKEIVRVYWDPKAGECLKAKPIMVKVFSGTENCPKEVFSSGWGNQVGKAEILQNFWGDGADVVLVEGMSYACGCGSTIRLLFLTYREGKYSIVEGPQLGGLFYKYKFDGDDGLGKKIIGAEDKWDDYSDYCCGCAPRLQFTIYTWDGKVYTKTVAGITQNKYSSESIDEILQKEPSVLTQQ